MKNKYILGLNGSDTLENKDTHKGHILDKEMIAFLK